MPHANEASRHAQPKRAGAVAFLVSGLVWISGLLVFFVGALLILVVGLVHTGPLFEWLVKVTCRGVLLATGVRLYRRGAENFTPGRQYILMMNHVNFLDPFVFYHGFPGNARGMEEASHFRWPLYGWVIRRVGQIPVNRRQPFRAVKSLEGAAAVLRRRPGFSVMILPEGTRSRDGRLGPFKRGGFLLAIESGLSILPLVQVGAYSVNRRGSRLIRPGAIDFIIEKPIVTKGYSRENIEELMEKTRSVFLHYVE